MHYIINSKVTLCLLRFHGKTTEPISMKSTLYRNTWYTRERSRGQKLTSYDSHYIVRALPLYTVYTLPLRSSELEVLKKQFWECSDEFFQLVSPAPFLYTNEMWC